MNTFISIAGNTLVFSIILHSLFIKKEDSMIILFLFVPCLTHEEWRKRNETNITPTIIEKRVRKMKRDNRDITPIGIIQLLWRILKTSTVKILELNEKDFNSDSCFIDFD